MLQLPRPVLCLNCVLLLSGFKTAKILLVGSEACWCIFQMADNEQAKRRRVEGITLLVINELCSIGILVTN